MPPDSYQDNLRRAMGVPTTSEKQKEIAEKARAEKELLADQPRRQALIREFTDTVWPMITVAFNDALVVSKEANVSLKEVQVVNFPPHILTERSFHCVSGAAHYIPALLFTLRADGKIQIDISRGDAYPPYHPMNFIPRISSISDVKLDHIQAVFVDYLMSVPVRQA